MALTLSQILHLYRNEGAARYGQEAISQEQHALQCGMLAEEAGAPAELVAACLLHDLGHLLQAQEPGGTKDDLHEYRALPFLRGLYPDAVLEPIRLHVPAKRFLCAVDPGYRDGLSPASRRSLELQGGPFSEAQADAFVARPFALEAVALRRWDDLAKCPLCVAPGWEHFRPALEQACLAGPGRLAA